MSRLFRILIPAVLGLFLSACAQYTVKESPTTDIKPENAATEVKPLPFPTPEPDIVELTPDIITDYLAAEIGAQRGALEQSYDYYLRVAQQTRDNHAAERAAKIAIHLNNPSAALRAARLWVEINPNSLAARQLLGLIELSEGRLDSARTQFDATLKIAEAKDQDGFALVAKMLISETNKKSNVRIMRLLTGDYPDSAEAQYALSIVEADAQLYEDALLSLEHTINLSPKWDKPRILQARILSDQGFDTRARQALTTATKDIPDSLDLQLSLSRLLIKQKDYATALDSLYAAGKLEPENPDVLLATGLIETELKQWDKARTTWQELRNQGSSYNEATYYLAQTEELSDNREAAIGLYGAVKSGRLLVDARIRLAQLLAEVGRVDEARDRFREARLLSKERSNDIYALEARSLIRQGEVEAAFELFDQAVSANPDDLDLRYNRAIMAAEHDQLDKAISDFENILAVEPEHVDALNALGYTLANQTDRYQEAYVYILKAYKLNPESPAIQDSLGWVHYRLGNLDEALKYLQKANSQLQDSEIAAHLGEVLWMKGEHARAEQIWQDALKVDPDSDILKEVMQRLR
ncbi:MAG: tetratricopeptide repeat protein [bacterium]